MSPAFAAPMSPSAPTPPLPCHVPKCSATRWATLHGALHPNIRDAAAVGDAFTQDLRDLVEAVQRPRCLASDLFLVIAHEATR